MSLVKEPDVVVEEAESGEVVGRGRLVLRRFLRRKTAVGGFVILVLLFLLAFVVLVQQRFPS